MCLGKATPGIPAISISCSSYRHKVSITFVPALGLGTRLLHVRGLTICLGSTIATEIEEPSKVVRVMPHSILSHHRGLIGGEMKKLVHWVNLFLWCL